MDELLVDFSDVDQQDIGEKKPDPETVYFQTYDNTTCQYYRSHRTQKTDPITFDTLSDDNSFEFPYMWNPLTGERKEADPFGSLRFHPINLLQHFYTMRLKCLWIDGQDGYEGYYGDYVGAGQECEITCRGIYPERYLFRLPIPNCYLKKGQNLSVVTMGPILTNREICEIDRLLTDKWCNHRIYMRLYNKIGSLFKLKHYYDVAISKDPQNMDLSGLELGDREFIMKQRNPNLCLNRMAVEVLKNMI